MASCLSLGKRIECSKGHLFPNVEFIQESLKLEKKNILNIYIVGSHLWSTCKSTSDFDLVVVVDHLSSEKPINAHKGNIEAFILSIDQYIELMNSHLLQVLHTLWLPDEFKLVEQCNVINKFKYSQKHLLSALYHTKERDYRVSQKHFEKKNYNKAKKILLHLVRYLTLAVQINETGRINDYEAANCYKDEILGFFLESWSELLEVVDPIVNDLLKCITPQQPGLSGTTDDLQDQP